MKGVVLFGMVMFTCFIVTAQNRVHTVRSGESLYSISKRYGVTIDQIKKANKIAASDNSVQIGQRIIIPSLQPASVTSAPTGNRVAARVHTVIRGESLYAICKKYGITISEVKQWNALNDLTIQPGQKLIVSKTNAQAIYRPTPVPSTPDTEYSQEDMRQSRSLPVNSVKLSERTIASNSEDTSAIGDVLKMTSSNPLDYPTIFEQYSVKGLQMSKQRGQAAYLLEATSGNQNLAFYSHAESGTIVRVTNLENQKTIFVKVIGKVPPADANREVLIKLSNQAAQDLGASDVKFLVEIASFSNSGTY